MYGRKAILSIDKTKSLIIYECMMSIMKKILYIKEEVRLMIQKIQDHMIQQISRKKRRFIMDEEVLCYNSVKE